MLYRFVELQSAEGNKKTFFFQNSDEVVQEFTQEYSLNPELRYGNHLTEQQDHYRQTCSDYL